MSPITNLAPAVRYSPATPYNPSSPSAAGVARYGKPSGVRLAWRAAAALAASIVLVIALVDPLLGASQYGVQPEVLDQRARHE